MASNSLMLFVFLFAGLLALAIPAVTGVVVYRDAKQRGMEAVLWALVAVLTPGLVGLIVYLAVRSNHENMACPSCGHAVKSDYSNCPNCGAGLKAKCESCEHSLEPDWKVCPQCGARVPEGSVQSMPAARPRGGKGLWILLVCLIAIPLLLLVIAIVGITLFTITRDATVMNGLAWMMVR